MSRVYIMLQGQGIFKPSEPTIRIRKVALRNEYESALWPQMASRSGFAAYKRRSLSLLNLFQNAGTTTMHKPVSVADDARTARKPQVYSSK